MARPSLINFAKRAALAGVLFGTAACGGAGPSSGGEGSATIVDGNLDGSPFVPQSAVFDVAHGATAIVIASSSDFCEYVQRSWSVEYPLPQSSEGLLVELNLSVEKPGKQVLLPGEAELIVTDTDCQYGHGSGSIDGSFTFDVVSADELSGTFDVDVHGTNTKVKFDAVRCDALLMPAPQKGECL